MSTKGFAPAATNRRVGRTLVILAALHLLFFVASLLVMPLLAPGASIPNPFAQNSAALHLYTTYGLAVRVSSFLQLLSALCLAALGAVWSQGEKEPLSHSSALMTVGSTGSAVLLALSALCSWALAAPGVVDPGPVLHTLQFLPFLLGGPGWSAFFGLFLLGLCQQGRTSLPRWMFGSGLFLAIVAELATLVLLTIIASPGLPIARFGGFLWLLSAAVMTTRPDTQQPGFR